MKTCLTALAAVLLFAGLASACQPAFVSVQAVQSYAVAPACTQTIVQEQVAAPVCPSLAVQSYSPSFAVQQYPAFAVGGYGINRFSGGYGSGISRFGVYGFNSGFVGLGLRGVRVGRGFGFDLSPTGGAVIVEPGFGFGLGGFGGGLGFGIGSRGFRGGRGVGIAPRGIGVRGRR